MDIPTNINKIEVYYDGRCGMCCTFHEWLNKQERATEVDFIPYQSERAVEVFPEILNLDPATEMVVRTDEGEIYKGAEAWVLCLHSCKAFQGVAHRMANPMLLPLAKKTCNLLAANRHKLSGVFFKKKNNEVVAELHDMELNAECDDEFCNRE